MERLSLCLTCLLVFSTAAEAQIVQSVNSVTSPGESEMKGARKIAEGDNPNGARLLTQGNVDASPDGTKIGIQAADLWISKFFRFYGRLTIPVTTPKADSAPSTGGVADPTETVPKLSATAKQQLVDPYGGLFNMSGGLFARLGRSAKVSLKRSAAPLGASTIRPGDLVPYRNPFVGTSAPLASANAVAPARESPERQIQREAQSTTPSMASIEVVDRRSFYVALARAEQSGPEPRDVEVREDDVVAADKLQDEHGLFLDVRIGLKFIELPSPGDTAPEIGGSKVNVFYTGIAGLKFIAPLYNAEPSNDPIVDGVHRTGGLTLGVYYIHNYGADTTQSSAYTAQLNKKTWAITGVVGWDLPNTEIAALTFSLTPKTSDTRMGKTFVFGLTLKKKTGNDSVAVRRRHS